MRQLGVWSTLSSSASTKTELLITLWTKLCGSVRWVGIETSLVFPEKVGHQINVAIAGIYYRLRGSLPILSTTSQRATFLFRPLLLSLITCVDSSYQALRIGAFVFKPQLPLLRIGPYR